MNQPSDADGSDATSAADAPDAQPTREQPAASSTGSSGTEAPGNPSSGTPSSGSASSGTASSGAASSSPESDGAVTDRFPVPPPPARRSAPAPSPRPSAPDGPRTSQDRAAEVLDRPVDDMDLATRLRRPGLARSTRILLLVLGAVACLAIGTFIGRATAPDTGPGSVPDVLGVVESVQPTGGGFPIVTVRAGDGTQSVLRTTAGTDVAVPRPGGPAGLRPGQQVTVHAERGADGAVTAVRVDVPAGS
ncbi:hypothetical protein Acsp06_48380 [Actinomycetospora sp. NBRC 106375]|uniref:hypothetical protein n=1 Tax=Actinomycetospora sp. NBRC 106375 TaxID=3032207 RepID=UPI00249FD90E|nr:hypothetical protein [Actinomycetospora sp. NBRC 106375]GLZ48653.1 hypothetical protein Acsp06_48380 [Actinomycetospora sp. NBRC 106375]